ncbi:MAG: hypothetical protein J4F35_22925 [Candidatus Latescibacteria bacterium]|nr:hypothetical protein [Candidatus Latescibacterota bacterium]
MVTATVRVKRWRLKIKMMTHKELIAKIWSQPKYKEKYDEAAPEFELLRKMLEARKRADAEGR